MKKLIAMALCAMMLLSLSAPGAAAFTDDAAIRPAYAEAVQALAAQGVLRGYTDGSFHPAETITRAEAAALVYRISTKDVQDAHAADYAGHGGFADVAAGAWYAGYVGYCSDAGLIKGYGNGSFGPGDRVTGYQTLAMILRALGYGKGGAFEGADWARSVEQTARILGVLAGVQGENLNAPAQRQLVAELLYRSLQAADDGQSVTPADPADSGALVRYTVAMDECDIARDLGLSAPGYVVEAWLDGVNVTDVTLLTGSNRFIDLQHPGPGSNRIGDQGRVTEIFAVKGGYSIVEVNTYFAQVTSVTRAKSDKNGHTEPATLELCVYLTDDKGVNVSGVIAEGFAAGDYVLVTLDRVDGDQAALKKNDTLTAAEIATIKPAKPSKIGYVTGWSDRRCNNRTSILDVQGEIVGTTEIDGRPMPDADKFFVGYQTKKTEMRYLVYEDGMGNLIALIPCAD